MRVLMVGAGERYHLEPLARCIKAADPGVWLGMHGLREPARGGTRPVENSPAFDAVYHTPPKPRRSKPQQGVSFAHSPTPPTSSNHAPNPSAAPALVPQVEGKGLAAKLVRLATRNPDDRLEPWQLALRIAWNLFRKRKAARHETEFLNELAARADVIHVQSLFEQNINEWLLRTQRFGFVVSCWGSEVLRQADWTGFLVQKALLQRAAVITNTGPEFKEILLTKFGRELEPKIHPTYFNPGVDALRPHLRPVEEIAAAGLARPFRVCIGHNAFEGGNHLELLSGFSGLDTATKSKIELIIPMTYGGQAAYRERVRAAVAGTGCAFRVLDTFLSEDEIRKFRAEIDILVFAPVSDAFAATVTQALACGSALITGAWLPYRERTRTGFSFTQIDQAQDAAAAVQKLMREWSGLQTALRRNRELGLEIFSEKSLGQDWLRAYQRALQPQRPLA